METLFIDFIGRINGTLVPGGGCVSNSPCRLPC